MNFGLRCAQIMAERPKNIIERTALWYRLERIGRVEEPLVEPCKPEPEWNRRQWGFVNQLQGQILHLSSKVNELRANANKGRKSKERHTIVL